MTDKNAFQPIEIAEIGKVRTSPLELGPHAPTTIHVLALTPKVVREQEASFLKHIEQGSQFRLLLTGGLAALTWCDARTRLREHFEEVKRFQDKLKEAGCDHRFEVRELDWTPSVGMFQVGESEPGSILYVSIYTPDPDAHRDRKSLLKLTKTPAELFDFYSGQFRQLWRKARPLDVAPQQRLRTLRRSAMARFREILEKTDEEEVEIAFVIALGEEFEEFMAVVGPAEPQHDEETGQYSHHFIVSGRKCLAVLAGEMGHVAVAQLVERLVALFAVRMVVSIGIAGGISRDVGVLDVVVASQVNNYFESTKATSSPTPGQYVFEHGGQGAKTTHKFKDESMQLRFAYPKTWDTWRKECEAQARELFGAENVSRPKAGRAAELFDAHAGGKTELPVRELAASIPRIHLTPNLYAQDAHLASGPIVGANEEFVRWLKSFDDRKIVAMEMEAGGLMSAANWRSQPVHTLVVRGISDLADEGKSGLEELFGQALRRAAMRNATSLVKSMLEANLLKPRV